MSSEEHVPSPEDPTVGSVSSKEDHCNDGQCAPVVTVSGGKHKQTPVEAVQYRLQDKYGRKIQPERLYRIPLVPIDCRFGVIREDKLARDALKATIKMQRRIQAATMTVVFCIRRPGCGSCRDHGQQLVTLVEELNTNEQKMLLDANSSHGGSNRKQSKQRRSEGQKVALVGVTKHGEGVDDSAMLNFYQTYFGRYPLFKDQHWKTYKALGGRKISYVNFALRRPKMKRRYTKMNIENVFFGGDIWTQGGVLVFDRSGELRHVQYEEYGKRLNVDEIRTALQQIQTDQRK